MIVKLLEKYLVVVVDPEACVTRSVSVESLIAIESEPELLMHVTVSST